MYKECDNDIIECIQSKFMGKDISKKIRILLSMNFEDFSIILNKNIIMIDGKYEYHLSDRQMYFLLSYFSDNVKSALYYGVSFYSMNDYCKRTMMLREGRKYGDEPIFYTDNQ